MGGLGMGFRCVSPARVVIGGLGSDGYGCTCTDVAIDLAKEDCGPSWIGSAAGPCSSGTWTATAIVTDVTGGCKLTITVSNGGCVAVFEETFLEGVVVPGCAESFDSDIPRSSASGSCVCNVVAATCRFVCPV